MFQWNELIDYEIKRMQKRLTRSDMSLSEQIRTTGRLEGFTVAQDVAPEDLETLLPPDQFEEQAFQDGYLKSILSLLETYYVYDTVIPGEPVTDKQRVAIYMTQKRTGVPFHGITKKQASLYIEEHREEEKSMDIANAPDNTIISGVRSFIKTCDVRKTKTNKHFLTGVLIIDGSEFEYKMWDVDPDSPPLLVGDLITITEGKKGSYNGAPQITIETFDIEEKTDESLAGIVPTSPIPREDLEDMFLSYVNMIPMYNNRFDSVSQLVERMKALNVYEPFMTYPAAKGHHHAYRHGLLEHTVSCAQKAEAIADIHPELQKDVLILGALMHDLAKVYEYNIDETGMVKSQTKLGVLEGHLLIGTQLVSRLLKGEDRWLVSQVRHIVASHHGNMEWGAIKEPSTAEAVVFHHIDMIDARLGTIRSAAKNAHSDMEFVRGLGKEIVFTSLDS